MLFLIYMFFSLLINLSDKIYTQKKFRRRRNTLIDYLHIDEYSVIYGLNRQKQNSSFLFHKDNECILMRDRSIDQIPIPLRIREKFILCICNQKIPMINIEHIQSKISDHKFSRLICRFMSLISRCCCCFSTSARGTSTLLT